MEDTIDETAERDALAAAIEPKIDGPTSLTFRIEAALHLLQAEIGLFAAGVNDVDALADKVRLTASDLRGYADALEERRW